MARIMGCLLGGICAYVVFVLTFSPAVPGFIGPAIFVAIALVIATAIALRRSLEERPLPGWAYLAGAAVNLTLGFGLGYLLVRRAGSTTKAMAVVVLGTVPAALVGMLIGTASYDASCSFDCTGWEGYGAFTAALGGAMISVGALLAVVNLFTCGHLVGLWKRKGTLIDV